MKNLVFALIVVLAPTTALAETIHIKVKGMVCSFCAQGIKKNFSKLPEVESVTPKLEEQKVVVNTKRDQTLSDAKIKEIIIDAGYEVVGIQREP